MSTKGLINENKLLILLYGIVFCFCLYTGAIYSYDTYDYLKAMPYRQLGYVIFLKSFQFIFRSFFDDAVVIFQALFSLFAVHFFYKTISRRFSFGILKKIGLLAILVFPFFNPLLIANNICTEGLSYGLYLLFVALCLTLLSEKSHSKYTILYYVLVYLSLVYIRGQFLFTTLIFATCYFLCFKKQIKIKRHLFRLSVFIVLPVLATLGTKSYHYFKDGFFESTPFAFVNASTSAFYISDISDANFIENEKDRAVFKHCYAILKTKQLLQSQLQDSENNYLFFHDHLPEICNQTVHAEGKAYLQAINASTTNLKQDVAKAYFDIESSCKTITTSIITHNFGKWLNLYFINLGYGFRSPIIAILLFVIMIFCFLKALLHHNKKNIILFLFATLTLSNALLIAFVGHSIMRYLFYNYVLLFVITCELINFIKFESKS